MTLDTGVVIAVVVVVLVVVAAGLLFRSSWRVAEPDEALVISGLRASGHPEGAGENMGFSIVTGRGALILPGVTKVRRLSLEAHESEISVPCVSQQKIRVDLRGIVVYKVGDDYRSIANAARRFLDRPAAELETKVQNVFVGHLRAIAGSMTVEDMISDQDKFTQQVRDRCTQEMESFGLVIDSFQIQAITSPSEYIENLAVPHQAEVEQNARIARANAERQAVAQEQTAQAQIAESTRNTEIKKAGYQAEVDQATKQAEQQGPLAEARARQAVVEQETRVAELQAQQTEQQLQVDVRKPADAEAYRQTTLAAAARDVRIRQAEAAAQEVRLSADAAAAQTRITAQAQPPRSGCRPRPRRRRPASPAQAEGDAIRARGMAEADAVQGAHGGRGDRHRAARRRAESQPGGGHRPADRVEPARDRACRRLIVRARRQLHGAQWGRRRHGGPRRTHPAGRRAGQGRPPGDGADARGAERFGVGRRWPARFGGWAPARSRAQAAAPQGRRPTGSTP